MEPVLSEPDPVAAILRELRLWGLLGQHAGGRKHTVVGAGVSEALPLLLLAPALAPFPSESCGAGDRVIPGLPLSSPLLQDGLLSSYRPGIFLSGFKQATVTFSFIFIPSTPSSPCLFN